MPDMDIDHINGIKTDNRLINLRLATKSQNSMNRSIRSDNKIGVKNVCLFRSGCYVAKIEKKGVVKKKYFKNIDDAAKWAEETRKELHGEHANNGLQIIKPKYTPDDVSRDWAN